MKIIGSLNEKLIQPEMVGRKNPGDSNYYFYEGIEFHKTFDPFHTMREASTAAFQYVATSIKFADDTLPCCIIRKTVKGYEILTTNTLRNAQTIKTKIAREEGK